MSVRVCSYPVPMREPGSALRYGSASSTLANRPVSPAPLISATTIAALSQQAMDLSISPNQKHRVMASTPTQSRTCSLPEIPCSPSAHSVPSSESPFIIQLTNITEKQKQQTLVKTSQHSTAPSSTFPNFRALQRLALSAKTRTVSHNKNSRRSSTTSFNPDLNDSSTFSKSSSSRTPSLQSRNNQTERYSQDSRQGQSLDDKGTPSGFNALQTLPGNRHSDLERQKSSSSDETIQVCIGDHSVSTKYHKKKSAKKKKRKTKRTKSRAHHTQKHPAQDTRRSNSDKNAPFQGNSLGTIFRAMPVVVKTKKVEVYSSRYSKCDTEKIVSQQNEKKSIDGEKRKTPKHTNSQYRDSSQGYLLSKVSPQGPDPVLYGSRVTPRIPGPGRPSGGSRDQDNMSRVTRVYLSEKQSGNLRDCGLILPCAPPGTPTPQMLQKYQYIPSMMDLTSQRAVRERLSGMEQKAKKKQLQQREEARKTEQQLQRDQIVALKQRQRREIYALNKIMTEFEEKNFHEFMKRMSGKTP